MPPLTIQSAFDLALQHHQAGRLQEAEKLYQQILAQHPEHADALHLLGVLAHQAGRKDMAANFIRRAIALKPDNAEAYCNLGRVLHDTGQLAESIAACQMAIALNPRMPQAYSNLGNAYRDDRQIDQALCAYRQAIALKPDYSEAYSNLGVVLKEKGQVEEAIAAWRKAIALSPSFYKAYSNLGNVLRELGQLDEAIAHLRKAIALNPNFSEAYSNLGVALKDKGLFEEATAVCRQAIFLNPGFPEAHNNLANAIGGMGQLDRAIVSCRQAIALNPNFPAAYNNLGNALKDKGQLAESVAAYRKAIALRPGYAEALSNLSVPLKDMGNLDEALAAAREAIALNPAIPEAHLNLGNILKDQGQIDEAIAAYRQAMALRPSYAEAGSNLLYALHFHDDYDARQIGAEHRQWNRQYTRPLQSLPQFHPNDRSLERPLRVGYVSPDFRSHPVGRFLLPLMEHHDRRQFKIFCYSDVLSPDLTTKSIRARADVWRNMVGKSDEALAAQVREDKIDILVDLTMHMARNRLLAFARKPAPVQVTYLAYCSTTGLDAMDYRLTDRYLDPPAAGDVEGLEEAECYSEKSIRLPDVYWCYDPGSITPDVTALPALNAGYITFGCLNNYAKVSPQALATWIQLLKEAPSSRLLLHARQGEHRQRMLDRLREQGVDPARLTFVDFLKGQEYFRQYHRIDIALDPFPYAGGTTTCDALWMGVPVITLAGRTAVGRAGVTLLNSVGMSELVAKKQEQYVRHAIDLASDLPRLAQHRENLRARMLKSPLTNAPKFAAGVEAAYRRMWREWCAKVSAPG